MLIVSNQLELSQGSRRDQAACLVDAELMIPQPALQKRGILYLITETETMAAGQPRPGDVELCRQAQEIILNEFYNAIAAATVTSALRLALEKANQSIYNFNSALPPAERRGLGLTAAVARGREIFLAQAPPTQAIMARLDSYQYLPAPDANGLRELEAPSGGGPARPRTLPNLGRYPLLQPALTRYVFEDGDLLLLCSSQFARELKPEDLEHIIVGQDSRSALAQLAEFAHDKGILDGYLLVVGARLEFGLRPVAREETGRRNLPEGVAGLLAARLALGNRSPAPAAADQAGPTSEDQMEAADSPPAPAAVAEEPPGSPDPLAPLQPASLPGKPWGQPWGQPWLQRENDDLNLPAYLRGREPVEADRVGGESRPLPPANLAEQITAPRIDLRLLNRSETGQPRPAALPEISLPTIGTPDDADWSVPAPSWRERWGDRQGPARRDRKLRPDRSPRRPKPPRVKKPSRLTGRNLALGLAGLLLVVALAGGALSFLLINNTKQSKALEAVQAADQKRAQAKRVAETEPGRARSLLLQAQNDLETARWEKPDLAEISRAENSLKQTLDNVNRVVVPTDLKLAFDLTSQGPGLSLTRAAFGSGGELYLLDKGQGAIYLAEAGGQLKALLKGGDKAGAAIFGKPLALAVRPDGLMVVDDMNKVWLYNRNSGNWSAQSLGGVAAWAGRTTTQAASYQGNLYLLGSGSGQILKYNAGAYGGSPEEWLKPDLAPNLGLNEAPGFAIDGVVYALTKEGRLLQLGRPPGQARGEVARQFDLKAGDRLRPPLNQPYGLAAGSQDFPYLLALDAEKRILQFNKSDGAFLQQYQAGSGKEFDNLQDVVVDEAGKRVYVIGPQKVYSFGLIPPLPVTPPTDPSLAFTPGLAGPAPTPRP